MSGGDEGLSADVDDDDLCLDAAAAAPELNILRPSREELSSSKVSLVCLISHMSGAFADVRWLVNGNSVTEGVFTGSAEQQPDKKFKMSSYLSIESSEWDKDTQLTCEATAASKTSRKSIKKSDCSDWTAGSALDLCESNSVCLHRVEENMDRNY